MCNSATNCIRNPFKHCRGCQNEAIFDSLLGPRPRIKLGKGRPIGYAVVGDEDEDVVVRGSRNGPTIMKR